MNDIPAWIIAFLRKKTIKCGLCHSEFGEDSLISVGIQESVADANKEMLTIGLYCKKCHEITLAEIKEMSLVDLSIEILENEENEDDDEENSKEDEAYSDGYNDGYDEGYGDGYGEGDSNKYPNIEYKEDKVDNSKSKNKKPKESKISQKEIKDLSNFLKTISSHDEMLMAMGLSPEEIEHFKKEGEKDRKNK